MSLNHRPHQDNLSLSNTPGDKVGERWLNEILSWISIIVWTSLAIKNPESCFFVEKAHFPVLWGTLFFSGVACVVQLRREYFERIMSTIHNPDNGILKDGVYRFSRNPLYVSYVIAQMWWMLWNPSVLNIFFMMMELCLYNVLIRREEKNLERIFGDAYTTYKRSVRRWL